MPLLCSGVDQEPQLPLPSSHSSCFCFQEHRTGEGTGAGLAPASSRQPLEHGSAQGQFQQQGRCWLRSCHSWAKVRTSATLLSKRAAHSKKILHRKQNSQIISPGPWGNNSGTVRGWRFWGWVALRRDPTTQGTSSAPMFNPELTAWPGVYLFKLNTNPQTMSGSEINVR